MSLAFKKSMFAALVEYLEENKTYNDLEEIANYLNIRYDISFKDFCDWLFKEAEMGIDSLSDIIDRNVVDDILIWVVRTQYSDECLQDGGDDLTDVITSAFVENFTELDDDALADKFKNENVEEKFMEANIRVFRDITPLIKIATK